MNSPRTILSSLAIVLLLVGSGYVLTKEGETRNNEKPLDKEKASAKEAQPKEDDAQPPYGNPIITDAYSADPSAHVFGDTLWVYPSHDRDDATTFSMEDYHAYYTYYLYHTEDCTFSECRVGGRTLPDTLPESPERQQCDVW